MAPSSNNGLLKACSGNHVRISKLVSVLLARVAASTDVYDYALCGRNYNLESLYDPFASQCIKRSIK